MTDIVPGVPPEDLLHKDKYQVFLFVCPAGLPLSFARHPWFVINKKGEVSRWEVFFMPHQNKTSWGHLHKDFYTPFSGIQRMFFSEKYLWKHPKLVGYIEGDADSLAARMAAFIEASPSRYPSLHKYRFRGPNSNTYAQWVLNNFPEARLRLPYNSFGKGKAATLI